MTKQEFKTRWESNADGGGIVMDDVVDCAQEWGVCSRPRTRQMSKVLYTVLLAAGVSDAEEFRPEEEQEGI